MSHSIQSIWPSRTAWWIGVRPRLSQILMDFPFFERSWSFLKSLAMTAWMAPPKESSLVWSKSMFTGMQNFSGKNPCESNFQCLHWPGLKQFWILIYRILVRPIQSSDFSFIFHLQCFGFQIFFRKIFMHISRNLLLYRILKTRHPRLKNSFDPNTNKRHSLWSKHKVTINMIMILCRYNFKLPYFRE